MTQRCLLSVLEFAAPRSENATRRAGRTLRALAPKRGGARRRLHEKCGEGIRKTTTGVLCVCNMHSSQLRPDALAHPRPCTCTPSRAEVAKQRSQIERAGWRGKAGRQGGREGCVRGEVAWGGGGSRWSEVRANFAPDVSTRHNPHTPILGVGKKN